MKQILLSVLMFVCAVSVKAQDVLVATLQSGENSQVFYGAGALKSAVNAAKDGDLITLSAGTFESLGSSFSTAITKFVKIQGAGYIDENNRTVINESLYVKLKGGNTEDFLLEGIYVNGTLNFSKDGDDVVNHIKLKRCRVQYLDFDNNTVDAYIEHCRIANTFYLKSGMKNMHVIGSIINKFYRYSSNCFVTFTNSIVLEAYEGENITFNNCILNSSYSSLKNNVSVFNCLGLRNDLFRNNNVSSPWYVTDASVWKSDVTGYSDTDLYELKDAYKKSGEVEVGIHGGANPYKSTPSNPQITKKNIAAKSSGGQLKVEITVEAQEK